MSTAYGEYLAAALALCCLAFAIARPRGLPEAAFALPAVALAVGVGWVTPHQAAHEVRTIGPTIVFLALLLVISHCVAALGVFRWIGGQVAAASGGRPPRLLGLVFTVAALTTAVLSLDATVVLLTPVALAAAARSQVPPRPSAYAIAHLSNSASLLLPVSNLTNLLAFSATGLSFVGFTAHMALPWVTVIAVEFVCLAVFFRRDLRIRGTVVAPPDARERPGLALVIIAVMLVGFGLTGPLHIAPVWVAAAAAALLLLLCARRRATTVVATARAASIDFCLFALAVAVLVAPAGAGHLGQWLGDLLPTGDTWGSLMLVALIAAVVANLCNNLPATLLLLAAFSHTPSVPPAAIIALLLGVNIGPNLTYVGSLATMLWRRIMADHKQPVSLATFTAAGITSTVLALPAAVTVLWLTSR